MFPTNANCLRLRWNTTVPFKLSDFIEVRVHGTIQAASGVTDASFVGEVRCFVQGNGFAANLGQGATTTFTRNSGGAYAFDTVIVITNYPDISPSSYRIRLNLVCQSGRTLVTTGANVTLTAYDEVVSRYTFAAGDPLSPDKLNAMYVQYGTLANRPTTSARGSLYHATDNNGLYYYGNYEWVRIDA